jgi:hypothetical protein
MRRLFALAAVVAVGVASVAAIASAAPGNGANTTAVCKLVSQPSNSRDQHGDGIIYVNPSAAENSQHFEDAQQSPLGVNPGADPCAPLPPAPLTPAASPAAAAVNASAARLTG